MPENNERTLRGSKKKKKKKKISIMKILILVILLTTFIVTGALGGWVYAIVKSTDPVDFSKMYTLLDENSFIYDNEGKIIEKVESEGLRTIVKYNEIPENLKNAFIAIEDQDFMTHKGINPKRIVKALWEDIKAREAVQGASTITQQLVKNLYLSNEKKIERKVKEAYYAIQMERKLQKTEILEAYLNTIYLGGGAKGVQGAAYTYFSKDISELDLAECALLAGITKNPSKYSPLKTLKKESVDPNKHFIIDDSDEIYTIVFDERYKPRQQLVLKIMKNENAITEEEYNQAMNEDIKTHLKPGKKQIYGISSFFTDKVKNDVIKALMQELDITEEKAQNMIFNQGLRIYSTIDLNMQKIVEAAYEDSKNFPGLRAKKDKYANILAKGTRSILLYKYTNIINNNDQLVLPKNNYQYDTMGNLILFKGKRLNFTPLYDNGEIKSIQISVKDSYKENEQKEILMFKGNSVKIPSTYKKYDEKKNVIVSKEFLDSNPQFFSKDSNGNLLISKDNYYISKKGVVQPQSSMVIMDQYTGEIKALVGGREVKGQKLYNRAIQPRQPGSSIKPIAVYAPAIDNGYTQASVIDDVPHYDGKGRRWPKNWNHKYLGLSTFRQGLQMSMNVVAVKIAEQIGIQTSVDYLKKMGITSIKESGSYNDMNVSAMALGGMTRGISPLEMTAAYSALANEGIYIKPKSFTKVTDRDGNIVLENQSYKNFVVSPEVAYIMTDMLKAVVKSGTAHRATLNNPNIPVAGKTGTTSDNYDAWFVGYTPYYAGAVWMGNDVHIELNGSMASKAKLNLWKKVMDQIHKDLPAKKFVKPKNIVSVAIDSESGKRATDLSRRDPRNTVSNYYFVKGTEPKEFDDVHVELEVDTTTNKLATPYCPPTLVEKRVFTKRPIPYDPAQNGGIVPTDYIYEAPTEYCPDHNEFNNAPIDIPIDPFFDDTNSIDNTSDNTSTDSNSSLPENNNSEETTNIPY